MEELIFDINTEDPSFIRIVSKALASITRLRIMKLLAEEQLDVTRIAERLDMTEANTSSNVKMLELAGLIETKYAKGVHGVRKLCWAKALKVSFVIDSQLETEE